MCAVKDALAICQGICSILELKRRIKAADANIDVGAWEESLYSSIFMNGISKTDDILMRLNLSISPRKPR